MASVKYFAALIGLLCLIETGFALECVYCNSTEYSVDNECIKGKNVLSKITCSYEYPCYAAKYDVNSGGKTVTLAYRGCMLPYKNCMGIKDQTQRNTRSQITRDECSTCNTHLCNSSSSLYIPVITLLLGYVLCKLY